MQIRHIAIVLLLLVAACGEEPHRAPAAEPLVAQQPAAAGSPSDSTTTSTAEPATTTTAAPVYIAPADALLVEIGFLEPWEETHRSELRPGYDFGPNQTDCPVFGAFDDLTAQPSASAGWWRDGFNLNHDVLAYDDADSAAAAVAAVGRIVDECPGVAWLEGGAFTVEALPLFDGALGFEFVEEVGEVRWFALLQRANVISRIEVVSFGAEPLQKADDLDGFVELVSEAARLLEAAPSRTEPAHVPTTTTTEAPIALPPPTVPPVTIPSLPEADRSLFRPLLIDEVDLDGVLRSMTRSAGGTSGVENCPPAEAFLAISEWLHIEADIGGLEEEWRVLHGVGVVAEGQDPIATVEAVAGIEGCDLSEFDASAVSGPLDDLPPDANAGSHYLLQDGDVTVAVGVLSMSDGVVSLFAYSGVAGAELDDLTPLIEIFVEKLPAFRSHVEACIEADLRFRGGETGPEVDVLERCHGLEGYLAFQAR